MYDRMGSVSSIEARISSCMSGTETHGLKTHYSYGARARRGVGRGGITFIMRTWPRAMGSRIFLRSDTHGGQPEAWRTQRNIHRPNSRRIRSLGSWLPSRAPIRRMVHQSRPGPHLYLLRVCQSIPMRVRWARGGSPRLPPPLWRREGVAMRGCCAVAGGWWGNVDHMVLVKSGISGNYAMGQIGYSTQRGSEIYRRAINAPVAPAQLAVPIADICLPPPHPVLRNRPVWVVELDYVRRVV